MKELGETLRDELVRQPWVSIVELQTARPYEYRLGCRREPPTLSTDLRSGRSCCPALPLLTCGWRSQQDSGDLLIQTRGQAYDRADFESIV